MIRVLEVNKGYMTLYNENNQRELYYIYITLRE